MKKILLLGLLLSPLSLMGMEPASPEHSSYYCVQKHAAKHYIIETCKGIDLPFTQTILDFGCKQGDISAELAERALCVAAFDDNKEAIEKAEEKYSTVDGLSFICKPVREEFATNYAGQFDLVTSFFCLERFKDDTKRFIFDEFFKVLKPGGWVFATIPTNKDDATLLEKAVWPFMKMMRERYDFLKHHTDEYLLGMETIEETDLEDMLTECGFDTTEINYSKFSIYTFQNKATYVAWQRSVFMEMPFAQILLTFTSPEELEKVCQEFADIVWDDLVKTGDAGAIYPMVTTVVVTQKPEQSDGEL